eukprot:6463173-Amphidinium_carterae.1
MTSNFFPKAPIHSFHSFTAILNVSDAALANVPIYRRGQRQSCIAKRVQVGKATRPKKGNIKVEAGSPKVKTLP